MKHKVKVNLVLIIAGIAVFVLGIFIGKILLVQNNVVEVTLHYGQPESNYDLDTEYEVRLSVAKSNIEICNINEEFTEKWRRKTDDNYDNIMEISNGGMRDALITGQEAWESFRQASIKEYRQYLEHVYEGGTIVPILLSKYEYELQRERAIALYTMYCALSRGKGSIGGSRMGDKGTVCVNPNEK